MKQAHAQNRKRAGNKIYLAFSLPLAVLLIVCSTTGLLHPEIYSTATPNWLAQTVGQDAVDLFLVTPLLIVSAVYAYVGNRLARILWGGTITYLVYTFLIYCFSVNFNQLFALYCVTLGLSFFALITFLKAANREKIHIVSEALIKVAGWYFIVVAVAFCGLWLMEILPASFAGHAPASVIAAGLPTNPVHVIDLSMFLPSLFLLGVMLLKKTPLAFYLAPAALVFFILMDLTIAALTAIMLQRGEAGDTSVLVGMVALAVFSFGMLMWFIRSAVEDLSHSLV